MKKYVNTPIVRHHIPRLKNVVVQVIHLVRDPRAMVNSMLDEPEVWMGRLKFVRGLCSEMLEDMGLQEMLPSER